MEALIANIARHVPLTGKEKELISSRFEPKQIARKEYLLRTGDVCRYDYFVKSGCLKVCYTDEKGNECIIKFAIEDWWVVDLDSFLSQKPAFYYIQAVENTEVFRINRTSYDALHAQIPWLQQFSAQRWQNGFIALQQRIMQSLSMTAEERFDHFKTKYPTLDQRISQKLIAAYLGVTPEFLSVLRKKWATVNS